MWCYDFGSYCEGDRVHSCVWSVLRFLNLKRFPRTRAQVGEGWRRPRCKLHRHSSPCSPLHCSAVCALCVSARVNCCAEPRRFHGGPRARRQPLHSTLAIFCSCNMLCFYFLQRLFDQLNKGFSYDAIVWKKLVVGSCVPFSH